MGRTVLIADSDAARGDLVRGACATRGFRVRSAHSGPEALELSISELPAVLIAGGELDTIRPAKLVEILRTNPRTRRIHCMLLGVAPDELRAEWGVVTLPADANPEEVGEQALQWVNELDRDAGDTDVREEIEGSLAQIPLADLLQLFHLNRRTGSFEMVRRGNDGRSDRGRVLFRDGDIVHATAGSVEGEKALFRLLTWSEGSFGFRPTRVTSEPRITATTRGLLLEGMRQSDEWAQHRRDLPAFDAQVTLRVEVGELPHFSHPLTQEVLLLLELYSSVGDVVDHSSYPDYQVLRTLQSLLERELIQVRTAAPAPPPLRGVFHPAQVRRLREWLRNARPDGAAQRDAKVLVSASDPAALSSFQSVLAELPGLQPHPAMSQGFSEHEVAPLARLAVDDELGIEFVWVPSEPAFAPLWPLAGYRALGALLLMAGASAEPRIKAMREALLDTPGARVFHLLMMREGDASAADQVRQNLQWLEDSELFLLPMGRDKAPTDLLRNAVSRLVP